MYTYACIYVILVNNSVHLAWFDGDAADPYGICICNIASAEGNSKHSADGYPNDDHGGDNRLECVQRLLNKYSY